MSPIVKLSDDASALGVTNSTVEGGVPVHNFLGIPYAQPPVGPLRFRAPEPRELWTGERDCTKFGAVCPQDFAVAKAMHDPFFIDDFESSEDCLFLNVTTPTLDPNARLPVMFWIHGGGFALGFSNLYRGDVLASYHDIVYVSCNYRLGPLGFMTTGDDVATGNYGILDQVEALKWVQKHIAAFGGDPDNVTIFGESAGGMAVSCHIMSTSNKGLFKRAISQSGVFPCPLTSVTKESLRERINPLLAKIGFDGGSSEELIEFLRQKTPEELYKAFPMDIIAKPVVDGTIFTDNPFKLYRKGNFQAVPYMTGITSHEGDLFLRLADLYNPDKPLPTEEDFRNHFKLVLSPMGADGMDAVADALVKLYVNPETIGDRQRSLQAYCDFYGDFIFNGPCQYTAKYHSRHAPAFVYLFAKRPPFSKDEDWVVAGHGHELLYSFGAPFSPEGLGGFSSDVYTDEDRAISKTMMACWTNFAKTGNPSVPGSLDWSPFSAENSAYMVFKANTGIAKDFEPARMNFWLNFMEQM